MIDELTDDDRRLLKALQEIDDPAEFARGLFEYYHDNGRARRTSREQMYLHLGMASGMILRPPAVVVVRDATDAEQLSALEAFVERGRAAQVAVDEQVAGLSARGRPVTELPVPEDLAAELVGLAPMELVLKPESVFTLVGLLQLALRHPDLSGHPRATAEAFVAGARAYFADCPAVLEVLEAGDRG